MRLLLDLGNTRVKWACQQSDEGWLSQGALGWDESTVAALAGAWADLPRPATVIAASVVDRAREERVTVAAELAFGRQVHWLRTPAQACGVRNAYARPQRLGVDRFLAMVAARADDPAPYVLAGVGTALTLDALDAEGRHLGGLIAPGPQLMQQSLLGATAQVRPERMGAIVELADNTADAVTSGCWLATAALIERFASRAATRLGGAPVLRLGGGDAERVMPLLTTPARLTRDAVLRGLAVWARAQ